MAAYLMTNAGSESSVSPDAGIKLDVADDGTIKYRRDSAVINYAIQVQHKYLTEVEFAALVTFFSTNGAGPHTFTLKGIDYTGTLLNEPAEVDRDGKLINVEASFMAQKV